MPSGGLDMALNNYKLGDLLMRNSEENKDLIYGISDVRGVRNAKGISNTKNICLIGCIVSKAQFVMYSVVKNESTWSYNEERFQIAP